MKKPNRKLNWIDGFVLAVLLLLVAGTVLKFAVLDPNLRNKDEVDVTYQVKIYSVRQYTVDALQVGDTVYDNAGKGEVGVIRDIQVEPAMSTVSFPDGSVANVPTEDRFDVILTIEARGVYDDENQVLKLDTYAIKVNQSSTYLTKYSIWSGHLLSIETTPREGKS